MAEQYLAQTQQQRLQMVLAPQLRQSLEMLQVPILELQSLIQQELQQNPTLEEQPRKPRSGWRSSPRENEKEDNSEELDFDKEFEVLAKLDDEWRDYFQQSQSIQRYTADDEAKRQFFLDSLSQPESLQEHLLNQLTFADLQGDDQQIGETADRQHQRRRLPDRVPGRAGRRPPGSTATDAGTCPARASRNSTRSAWAPGTCASACCSSSTPGQGRVPGRHARARPPRRPWAPTSTRRSPGPEDSAGGGPDGRQFIATLEPKPGRLFESDVHHLRAARGRRPEGQRRVPRHPEQRPDPAPAHQPPLPHSSWRTRPPRRRSRPTSATRSGPASS